MHGLNVHVGTITFWELWATLTPAIIVPAHKVTFSIAGNVAKCCLDKCMSEVVWQNDLQAFGYRSDVKEKKNTKSC